jgi:hypothetical protein
MKRLLVYTSLALTLLCVIACQRNQKDVNTNPTEPTFFPTPEEAANKAKTDLLSILRSRKNMNLGVDAAALAKSQPARLIKQYQITFEKLTWGGLRCRIC